MKLFNKLNAFLLMGLLAAGFYPTPKAEPTPVAAI